MMKNVLIFLSGCLTALVGAVFYSGQSTVKPLESEFAPSGTDSSLQARSVVRIGTERTREDLATVVESEPARLEITNRTTAIRPDDLDRDVEARTARFAEAFQLTPEEIVRLLEDNLNALVSYPDRQTRLADQAATNGARLPYVENIVTNELWRNAYTTPPINVESECYPAGCRVKLFFTDTEELVEVASGSLDLRMLLALRDHGFSSSEIELGFGEDKDPDAPAESVDVFLWPEPDSHLQFLSKRSLR